MSATATAADIYRGMQKGRDVVVPGWVNKFYAFFLSRLLPPAAVGAMTRIAWSPAPSWLPFLRPLSADLQREQAQAHRRRREQEHQQALQQEREREKCAKKGKGGYGWPSLPSFGGLWQGQGPQLPLQDEDDADAGPVPSTEYSDDDDDESLSEQEEEQEEDQEEEQEAGGAPRAWDGSDDESGPAGEAPTPATATAPPPQPQPRQATPPPLPPPAERGDSESRKDDTRDPDDSAKGGADREDAALVRLRPGMPGRKSWLVIGPRAMLGLFGRLLGRGKPQNNEGGAKGEAHVGAQGSSQQSAATQAALQRAQPEAEGALDVWRRDAAGAASPRHRPLPSPIPLSPPRASGSSGSGVTDDTDSVQGGNAGAGWLRAFRQRMRRWVVRFWDQPVINYPALRRFASQPFARRGTHIVIDDDDDDDDAPRVADPPSSPSSPSVRNRAHADDTPSGLTRCAYSEGGALLPSLPPLTSTSDDEVDGGGVGVGVEVDLDTDTNSPLSLCALRLVATAATASGDESMQVAAPRPWAVGRSSELRTVFAHDVPVSVSVSVSADSAVVRAAAVPDEAVVAGADRVVAAMLLVVLAQHQCDQPGVGSGRRWEGCQVLMTNEV